MRFLSLALGLVCAGSMSSFAQSGREQSIVAIQDVMQAGRAQEAGEMIEAALKRYPKDPGILNLRGVLHAQGQEIAAARADFAEAVGLAPDLLPARQNLARACMALAGASSTTRDAGAMECAVQNWRRVLASRRDDAEARSALATLYEWRGEFSESLKEIDSLPREEADGLPLLALRCADLAGMGRINEALQSAKRLTQSAGYSAEIAASIFPVLRKPETAPILIALAEPLDNAGEASAETLRFLGAAYEKTARLSDARKALEKAAAMEPGKTADLYELTRLAYQARDYEGALGYLGHIRDLAPKDARAHFLFGIVAIDMDLPIEARKSLERALELDPKNPIYSLALGSVILSSRDAGDAIPYFQTYLAAHPDDPRGHLALGMAYYASNDYEKSRAQMDGIAGRPETAGSAEYFLGRISRAEDNLDDSVVHLKRAIELLPKFPDARAEIAKVWLKQGEIGKARAALDGALTIDKDNYQANVTLLALYEKTHDAKAAAQRDRLKELEGKRKAQEQLMFRTIETRPF